MKQHAARSATGDGSAQSGGRRKVLLFQHYWHRLLGTAIGWFAWDFYYCERSGHSLALVDSALAHLLKRIA